MAIRRGVLAVGLAATLSLPAPPAGGDVAVTPVDALRPGATGYGVTVLRGAGLDTFAVEILGVEADALAPGVDLILARLSGAGLEETGVVRGMSGSPVYVDGGLIGAVAYGWSFSKLPICGITPIRNMLAVMERDLDRPGAGSRIGAVPGAGPGMSLHGAGAGLVPLASPVWVSGATGASSSALKELLDPYALQIVAGPGGGSAPGGVPSQLGPGSAAGAQLVRGDLSVTAIGTITHVEGDRLVAFGHPLLGLGGVDVPLTGAHIYDVMPSQLASFKLGAATTEMGVLRQDRLPGVAGLLGAAADLLPVTVTVGQRAFSFEVLPHRLLAPGLVRAVLLTSLQAEERLLGDATLEVRTLLNLRRGRRVERQQVYGGANAIFAAALEAAEPVAVLGAAPFDDLELESLSFEVQVRDAVEAASLVGLRVDRARPAAGDTVAVTVRLQPYRRPPEEVTVHLALPAGLPPGPLQVRAGSGRRAMAWDRERRPDGFEPRRADELLELLGRPQRDDEIIIELTRGEEGLSVDGRELPGLPPSARAVLAEGHRAGRIGAVHGRVVARAHRRTGYALSGDLTAQVEVATP